MESQADTAAGIDESRDRLLLESYRLYMERLNSEISVHWSRVNIVVTGLIAAIGGYGYLLWNAIEKIGGSASVMQDKFGILLTLASFAALTINIAAIRILRVGKRWQEVCEGRLMAIESLLYEPHLKNSETRGTTTSKQSESIYLHSSITKLAKEARFKPSLNDSYASLLVTLACLLAGLCIGHVLGASLAIFGIRNEIQELSWLLCLLALLAIASLIACAVMNLFNELCLRLKEKQLGKQNDTKESPGCGFRTQSEVSSNSEQVNIVVARAIRDNISRRESETESVTNQNEVVAKKRLSWYLLGLLCSAMVLRVCSSKDVKS